VVHQEEGLHPAVEPLTAEHHYNDKRRNLDGEMSLEKTPINHLPETLGA